MKPTANERVLEKYLFDKAKENKCLCFKWVSPGHPGVPDRILIYPSGKVMFIELKRNRAAAVSALQTYYGNILTNYNCNYKLISNKAEVDQLFT